MKSVGHDCSQRRGWVNAIQCQRPNKEDSVQSWDLHWGHRVLQPVDVRNMVNLLGRFIDRFLEDDGRLDNGIWHFSLIWFGSKSDFWEPLGFKLRL